MATKSAFGCGSLVAAALVVTNLISTATAQQPGPRFLESAKPALRHTEPGHNIRVDVNLVLVPVTVTDRLGRVVYGLTAESFRIFEDAVVQPVVSFSSEDVPCSVGLLFDTSGSMRNKIGKARLAAKAFLETANPEDEVFLITFANRPVMQVDFTFDVRAISNGLLFASPHGSTALIDAIHLALAHMRSARNPRKALLIISDGGDNNSRYSEKELRQFAMEADVQIYAIGIHDDPRAREEMNGPLLLGGLAKITGGEHFMVRDINELSDVAAKIGVALHDQYVIGYRPPENRMPGKWRKIQVKLSLPKSLPPLQVYARSGYYAPGR